MYQHPFPKGEPGSEDEEEDITGLFETDNSRLKVKLAQLHQAYRYAKLEENEELKAEIIREAREMKGISQ